MNRSEFSRSGSVLQLVPRNAKIGWSLRDSSEHCEPPGGSATTPMGGARSGFQGQSEGIVVIGGVEEPAGVLIEQFVVRELELGQELVKVPQILYS